MIENLKTYQGSFLLVKTLSNAAKLEELINEIPELKKIHWDDPRANAFHFLFSPLSLW
jgi:hypothetical protein